MENKTIFSAEKLKKATERDMLNETIHVTGYGSWMVVAACVLVLIAIIIWSATFSIDDVIVRAASCEDNVLTVYYCDRDARISEGTRFSINDGEYVLPEVSDRVIFPSELPNEVKRLLPEDDRYYCAELDADLEDGYYLVHFMIGRDSMISYLVGGR